MTTLYKCNKCESLCGKDEHKVTGKMYMGGRTYDIHAAIQLTSDDDEERFVSNRKDIHVCRNCFLDALNKLDTRPKVEKHDDLFEEPDGETYIPEPTKKPRKIPSGLDKMKGIVE